MLDDIYVQALRDLWEFGRDVRPRGLPCKELIPSLFSLESPDDNIVLVPGFETNLRFAEDELAWYYSGSDRIDFSARIAHAWAPYSDDGIHVKSNYGNRAFRVDPATGMSPWERAKAQLVRDPDSRRALLPLLRPEDLDDPMTNEVPCAVALQPLIREGRLEWTTLMRSNDVVAGLRNDVYCFTEMQKRMARELGLPAGPYHHVATSLHLYERDYAKVELLLSSLAAPGPDKL